MLVIRRGRIDVRVSEADKDDDDDVEEEEEEEEEEVLYLLF